MLKSYIIALSTASLLTIAACGARSGGGGEGGYGEGGGALTTHPDKDAGYTCHSASTCPPVECTLSICNGGTCEYIPLQEGMCCGEYGFQCLGGRCACDGEVNADGTCLSSNQQGKACASH